VFSHIRNNRQSGLRSLPLWLPKGTYMFPQLSHGSIPFDVLCQFDGIDIHNPVVVSWHCAFGTLVQQITTKVKPGAAQNSPQNFSHNHGQLPFRDGAYPCGHASACFIRVPSGTFLLTYVCCFA
jgi:hypothetical protein